MYREPLPEGCPPAAADEVVAPREVFRLVSADPPTEADFQSQRAQNPAGNFSFSECQARGLSVFADPHDAMDRALKLPKFRGYLTCRVVLKPGAGRVQQTFKPSHHTWWPFAAFDILGDGEAEIV